MLALHSFTIAMSNWADPECKVLLPSERPYLVRPGFCARLVVRANLLKRKTPSEREHANAERRRRILPLVPYKVLGDEAHHTEQWNYACAFHLATPGTPWASRGDGSYVINAFNVHAGLPESHRTPFLAGECHSCGMRLNGYMSSFHALASANFCYFCYCSYVATYALIVPLLPAVAVRHREHAWGNITRVTFGGHVPPPVTEAEAIAFADSALV